jgi:hypothetical protein
MPTPDLAGQYLTHRRPLAKRAGASAEKGEAGTPTTSRIPASPSHRRIAA